jgi:hypothetical protein
MMPNHKTSDFTKNRYCPMKKIMLKNRQNILKILTTKKDLECTFWDETFLQNKGNL